MLADRKWNVESILRLVAWMSFSVFAIMLAQLFAQHALGAKKFHEGATVYLVFASLSLHGSILLGTWIDLRLSGVAWGRAFGFLKAPFRRAIPMGLLATLLFMPVCEVLQIGSAALLKYAGIHLKPQMAVEEFSKAETSFGKVYLAIFAVFFAPLAEEVLFRGIIYGALRDLGFPKLAFWLSAILFALIHQSLAIFVPILALGLIFAWLYEKTGNLLSSITAHAAFNALNVALLLYQGRIDQFMENRVHFFH